jgi:cell division protein FtsW (lipid II flippase)
MAIINGGLFGKGITGRGMNIVGVPEAHTDFIFSIMCETFGYLGIMIFLFLFALFLFKGYKLAMAAKSMYYKLLAFGISFLFTLHFIINIGVVIGLFPITGITLPFFSYGGTSIVCSMICVGILLNVSNNLNS